MTFDTATYDAWNRLVKVADGSSTVAEYEYDGLNRRIVKSIYSGGSLDHRQHFYYNEDWQVLEVRKETSGTEDPDPLEQFIWHPDYIDAPALRFYDAATSGSQTIHYYTYDANYNVTALLCVRSADRRGAVAGGADRGFSGESAGLAARIGCVRSADRRGAVAGGAGRGFSGESAGLQRVSASAEQATTRAAGRREQRECLSQFHDG